MLKIRLKRIGRKHDPSFRVVVTEVTAPPKGKYKEAVGFYNSALKQLKLNTERIKYWLSVGAQATSSVHNLLVKEGVIEAQKQRAHSTRVRKSAAKEEKIKEVPIVKDEISQTNAGESKVDIEELKTEAEEEKQPEEEKIENVTDGVVEPSKEKNEKEVLIEESKKETSVQKKVENKEQENEEDSDVPIEKSEGETSIPDVLVEAGENIGEVAESVELNPSENLENDVKQDGGKSKKDKKDKAGDKEKTPEEKEESLL